MPKNGAAMRYTQKSGGTKLGADPGVGWETELFGASASVSHEHSCRMLRRSGEDAVNERSGIVNQFAAALLQFVHQRVLLVRIKRFVEPAEFTMSASRGASKLHRISSFSPRALRDPTASSGRGWSERDRLLNTTAKKNSFQERGLGGHRFRTPDHLDRTALEVR